MKSKQMRRQGQELGETATETGTNPIVLAAGASVLLSWYHYFVRGNREMGIFVGLWPPTLLAFASYFELERITARVEQMFGGRLMDSVKRMMRGESR